MYILGIETSCDETASAVIHGEGEKITLLANTIASSLQLHSSTGGIIPEQAAREQLKWMLPVIEETIQKSGITMEQIDALAVTYGPGLIGSLLVGVETIKTLSYVLNKPIIPVNHMIGHIYANWIENKEPITFPAIALVVSGGHTDLLLLKNHGDIHLLGGTRDDAAGECFDKCARLLGYAYPGGPHISKLAETGNDQGFDLPRPMLGEKNYDFSFSGLKTAFLNTTKKHFTLSRTNIPNSTAGWEMVNIEKLSQTETQKIHDLCASLERAIVDVLVKKVCNAVKQYKAQSLLLSGGVAANKLLRAECNRKAKAMNVSFFVPSNTLCTDNAAMIASAAYYNNTKVDWHALNANPELYFDE